MIYVIVITNVTLNFIVGRRRNKFIQNSITIFNYITKLLQVKEHCYFNINNYAYYEKVAR